jgi:hypothetical protein
MFLKMKIVWKWKPLIIKIKKRLELIKKFKFYIECFKDYNYTIPNLLSYIKINLLNYIIMNYVLRKR